MSVRLILEVLRRRRRLRRRERWSREELDRHRAGELARLRAFAVERSPFYQRLHRGLEGRPLHELPVVSKRMLMDSFDELVTDRQVRHADVLAHLEELRADELFLDRYLSLIH